MTSHRSITLPRGWPNHIKTGLLHAISLGATALTVACSRYTGNRLQTELNRADNEIALLKEELALALDVEDGEILALSKGVHLWEHSWDWAKCRLWRDNGEAP